MKFCPNCGSPVQPNATFCTKCGFKLNNSNNVQVNQPVHHVANNTSKYKNKVTVNILIFAVLILLGGFLIYRQYMNRPAHNPNNPLSNTTIVVEDDPYYGNYMVTKTGFGLVYRNLVMIVYKKMGASSDTLKEMKSISPNEWFSYYHTGDSKEVNDVLNEDKTIKDLFKKDYSKGTKNILLKLEPNKHLKVGQKVKVKVQIDSWFAQKYGIDATPLSIKISKINR